MSRVKLLVWLSLLAIVSFVIVFLYVILDEREDNCVEKVLTEGFFLPNYCRVDNQNYVVDTASYAKKYPNERLIIINNKVDSFKYLIFYKNDGECMLNYSHDGLLGRYVKEDTLIVRNERILKQKIRNYPKGLADKKIGCYELFPYNLYELIKLDLNHKVFKNVHKISKDEYLLIEDNVIIHITKFDVSFYIH